MLVELNKDNKIVNIINISSATNEQEFMQQNEGYIITNFDFVEDIDLYEYDEVNNTFALVVDWETIKAQREAQSLPTLEDLKTSKINALNAYFNEQYKFYLAQYPEIEQDSFKDKAKESALVIDDAAVPLSSTYYLTKLAKADLAMLGNTTPTEAEITTVRNEIAVAVDAKADFVSKTERQAVYLRDAIKAIAIESFTSEAEAITALDAISW